MANNNTKERITRNEEQIKTLFRRMERFENLCSTTQKRVTDSIISMGNRIDVFLDNEVHDLEEKIEEAKNTNRRPWGRLEWTAIITTIILTLGNLIVELIRMKGAG